jgi:hypothetical protein
VIVYITKHTSTHPTHTCTIQAQIDTHSHRHTHDSGHEVMKPWGGLHRTSTNPTHDQTLPKPP